MSAKRTAKSSPRRKTLGKVPTLGRANLAKLRRLTDREIDRTSPEELRGLPKDFWDDAVPVLPSGKVPISLRVDVDVLEFFRESGPRYQSRMNAVLRSFMERTSTSRERTTRRAAGSPNTR
jgi:uncharacterized protein (DUF4415 family)